MITAVTLTLLSLLLIPFFMILSRMQGGGKPDLPLGLDAHVLAGALTLPVYFLLAASSTLPATWEVLEYTIPSVPVLTALTYSLAFLGIRLGHGQYMTLPYSIKRISAEKIDFLIAPFFGQDPRTRPPGFKDSGDDVHNEIFNYGHRKLLYRNLAGLALTGAVVTLGATISLGLAGYPVLATWAFIAGSLKWSGYREDTESGEYIRGFFLGLFAMSCTGVLINLSFWGIL